MIALQIIIIVVGLWIPLAIYTKISKHLVSSGLSWHGLALDLAAVFISSAMVFGIMTFALTINTNSFGDLGLIAKIAICAGFAFTGIAILKLLLVWVLVKVSNRIRRHPS